MAEHRRQKREWARKRDRTGKVDSRPGSRHAGNLCCFKRPHRCKCDYELVEAAVCERRLSEFLEGIRKAQLQTILDTADCGPFLSAYRGAEMSPVWKWGTCAMYRYLSNWGTWQALVAAGAVRGPKSHSRLSEPNWAGCAAVLEDLWARGPIFGNGRRPCQLRGSSATVPGHRAAEAMRILWDAAPLRRRLSTSDLLGQALSDFQQGVGRCGLLGDYTEKCLLDVLVPCLGLPEAVYVPHFPTNLPTYKESLDQLFSSRRLSCRLSSDEDYRLACCWLARAAATASLRLGFFELMAQLCWWKRREAGSLKDMEPPPSQRGKKRG